MKIVTITILVILLGNLVYGINPRKGYGKYESAYYPVERFTKYGAKISLKNEKKKNVRWEDVRIVPSGSEFSDVELIIEASKPEFILIENKIKLRFSIKSNKHAKDLMLLIVTGIFDIESVKIPELHPGKSKVISAEINMVSGIRLIAFDGDREVRTNIRKPFSGAEEIYSLEGKSDREPAPIVRISPKQRLGNENAKIKVNINTLGLVTDATVVETSSKSYGKSAKKAAERWIFVPKVKDSKLVESSITIPFSLSNN